MLGHHSRTTASLVAPLCLSLTTPDPPSLIYSLTFSWLFLVPSPVQPQPFPTPVPRFWSLLRLNPQLAFLWEGQILATSWGAQAHGLHQHGRSCSEGRWGRTSSLGPSQDTCPPICPWPLPLTPITFSFQPSSSASAGQGSVTMVPRLL